MGRQRGIHIGREMGRQMGHASGPVRMGQTERHTERQTQRHTERHTHNQRQMQTDGAYQLADREPEREATQRGKSERQTREADIEAERDRET